MRENKLIFCGAILGEQVTPTLATKDVVAVACDNDKQLKFNTCSITISYPPSPDL